MLYSLQEFRDQDCLPCEFPILRGKVGLRQMSSAQLHVARPIQTRQTRFWPFISAQRTRDSGRMAGYSETGPQPFTLFTKFLRRLIPLATRHPFKVEFSWSITVRRVSDFGRSRHAKTAPRTTPMFVPQVAVRI